MRVEKHRRAAIAQLGNDVANEKAAQRVEPGRRLVEEDQHGIVEKRLRQPRSLHHAFAVATHRPIGGFQQIDSGKQSVDAHVEVGTREPIEPPVEAQQLACGQAVVKSKVLGQESDAGARQSIAKRLTQHAPVAAVGMHQAEEHLDRGGFAGAVRAEKSGKISPARTDSERSATASVGPNHLRSPCVSMTRSLTAAILPS